MKSHETIPKKTIIQETPVNTRPKTFRTAKAKPQERLAAKTRHDTIAKHEGTPKTREHMSTKSEAPLQQEETRQQTRKSVQYTIDDSGVKNLNQEKSSSDSKESGIEDITRIIREKLKNLPSIS